MRCVGWWIAVAVVFALISRPCFAELEPNARKRYESTINKARDRLLALNKTPGSGEAALAAYALIKSGLEKTHPQIREITAGTVARINSGAYTSGPEPAHHVYEGACDAMLLAEVDPVAYRPQLEILRDYLVRKQLPSGAWYYPNATPESGDTSITQFALLGLWAAKRAGLEVPMSAWERCARWLISTQRNNGGFSYHPFETGNAEATNSTPTMTAAGCGSLLIIRRMLYADNPLSELEPPHPPATKKRFGVLETLTPEKDNAANKRSGAPTVPEADLRQAIKQGQHWLAEHFDALPPGTFTEYFYYGCERTGALLDTEMFGSHRWYDEGAKILVATQRPSGQWESATPLGGGANPTRQTIFALLFLSRATQTIITPPPPKTRLHGGGLLGGGRGLPDDLSQVDVQGGEVKRRVPKSSLDALLTDLERPAANVSDDAQKAVVEAVQLEHREELIGQIDRLRKLVKDSRPEVRQVAVWALGRSDDLRHTPLLIAALMDPDLEVAAEAGTSLCVLSRQPDGVRAPGGKDMLPVEPPEPREQEDAASYEKRAKAWQTAARAAWNDWYLQVRPYDERNDRQELRKK